MKQWKISAAFYGTCALLLLVTAGMIQGCTQLGLATPQTFEERLAVGYSTVTTVRQTAATLLTAKRISAEDGSNVLLATDNARTGLDVARKLGSAAGGDAKITQVLTGLQAMSQYLESRK